MNKRLNDSKIRTEINTLVCDNLRKEADFRKLHMNVIGDELHIFYDTWENRSLYFAIFTVSDKEVSYREVDRSFKTCDKDTLEEIKKVLMEG